MKEKKQQKLKKIKDGSIQIWKEIEGWVEDQSVVKISSSDSMLLRDARGMNDTFSPTVGQAKRLMDIYGLVKEFGFEEEL